MKTCKFEITAGLSITSPLVQQLLGELAALAAVVALWSLAIERQADLTHVYELMAADGRRWKQVLKVPAEGEYQTSYEITDFWGISECILHRTVLAAAVRLLQGADVAKVEIKWLD